MAVISKNYPAPERVQVKRALLSVSDKTGLIEFAMRLSKAGVELVSTGGTARSIAEAGLPVRDVSELTGFPEIMDGRVKTLHPGVHGGLLAIRDDAEHTAAMEAHNIGAIDLAVINLYPFEEVRASGGDYATMVENIDIGGPAMIRAAAKNHAYVGIVTDPADYDRVAEAIESDGGALGLGLRKELAALAYARTAAYDSAISGWFAEALELEAPRHRAFGGSLREVMRYGENPHQKAAFYVDGNTRPGVATAELLQGKQLSYNNINDTDAAFELVSEFGDGKPACAIIKHANPCGVAVGDTLLDAYRQALRCDPVSAFGGIIAFNRELDGDTASAIVARQFVEVIIAPRISAEAREAVASKTNVRLLECGVWGCSGTYGCGGSHAGDTCPVWSRHYSSEVDDADCQLAAKMLAMLGAKRIVVAHNLIKESVDFDYLSDYIPVETQSTFGGEYEISNTSAEEEAPQD